MTPDQISQAISGALSDGGEQLLEGTLAAVLPILWLLMLALHLARPYMLNVVQKFSLRLGADIWWLAYVAIRDMLISPPSHSASCSSSRRDGCNALR